MAKDKLKKLGLELTADGKLRTRMTAYSGITGKANLAAGKSGEATITDNYMTIPFRALSSIMLPDRPVDFSKPGVVAAAAPMLNDLTMYADHLTMLSNWLGKTANGRVSAAEGDRPEGIDFDGVIYCGEDLLATDPKQGKLIIGLREGIVKSCSVGVEFSWEKSHPDMKDYLFWDQLGEEVDGEIVRAIVTEITGIYEVSLVWEGADPHAKRLDMAKLPSEFGDKYAELMSALEDGDTENLSAILQELEELREKVTSLSGDVSVLEEEKKQAIDAGAELKEKLEKVELELQAMKAALIIEIRTAMKASGNEALVTEEFNTFLRSQSYAELSELHKTYQDKLEKAIPLTCASCGSTNIGRRSSVQNHQTESKPIHRNIDESQYKLKK